MNKQASDKGGNLFFRCRFNERERQQDGARGGGGWGEGVRKREDKRRAQCATAHNSEICRIWHNYPGKDC